MARRYLLRLMPATTLPEGSGPTCIPRSAAAHTAQSGKSAFPNGPLILPIANGLSIQEPPPPGGQ